MSAIPPATVYYPKFGGSLAAISPQKGAAWDVDGFSSISAEFPPTSRATWLVFELRKADDWEISDPVSSHKKGN